MINAMNDTEFLINNLDTSIFQRISTQATDNDKESLLACQAATRNLLPTYNYLEIGSYRLVLPHSNFYASSAYGLTGDEPDHVTHFPKNQGAARKNQRLARTDQRPARTNQRLEPRGASCRKVRMGGLTPQSLSFSARDRAK
jgi:hypothetical protein